MIQDQSALCPLCHRAMRLLGAGDYLTGWECDLHGVFGAYAGKLVANDQLERAHKLSLIFCDVPFVPRHRESDYYDNDEWSWE